MAAGRLGWLSVVWLSLVLVGWGPESGLWAQAPGAGTRLEARVVDDASGEPLAARVAVTNPDGKLLEVEGRHERVQYLGKRWCYMDGSFALTIPEGGVQLEIRRGFETRPLSATVASNTSGKSVQRTFRLRRWIDMRRQGSANDEDRREARRAAEEALRFYESL